jgi:hypothetical protein
MIRGIARLLATIFGALVLLSAIIFVIVAFNERETAIVLANSLWATLQGGRYIEATSPQPHVDYFAETALRISFFTFLVSTSGTDFTLLFPCALQLRRFSLSKHLGVERELMLVRSSGVPLAQTTRAEAEVRVSSDCRHRAARPRNAQQIDERPILSVSAVSVGRMPCAFSSRTRDASINGGRPL